MKRSEGRISPFILMRINRQRAMERARREGDSAERMREIREAMRAGIARPGGNIVQLGADETFPGGVVMTIHTGPRPATPEEECNCPICTANRAAADEAGKSRLQ